MIIIHCKRNIALKILNRFVLNILIMMNPEIILKSKKTILFAEKRRMTSIVIGSPHHAPGGVEKLKCNEHLESDENSGIIARRVAEKLHVSSIIACNYHIDANKSLGTDYSLQIIKWKPKYLIEIHGHGGRIKDNHEHLNTKDKAEKAIEISSGSDVNNELSKKFAAVLQDKLNENSELKFLTVHGDLGKIYFKASDSATIVCGNWKALHIELPPKLRKRNGGKELPEIANDFIDILAEIIEKVCK